MVPYSFDADDAIIKRQTVIAGGSPITDFNQLLHLGRAYNRLFEVIYDDYPHVLVFRLQSQ